MIGSLLSYVIGLIIHTHRPLQATVGFIVRAVLRQSPHDIGLKAVQKGRFAKPVHVMIMININEGGWHYGPCTARS